MESPLPPVGASLEKSYVTDGKSSSSIHASAVSPEKFATTAAGGYAEYPSPFVRGQTIVGLFPCNESEAQEDYLFSNGTDVDLLHRVHSVMESPKDKLLSERIMAVEGTNPSDALIVAAVNCFSKKKKRHFFRDGLYLCSVFSHELSMRLSTFLQVRGWTATKRKDGTILIAYRRIGDCVRLIGSPFATNYLRVSSMFDRLYRALNSREIWPVMPYEKGACRLLFLYGSVQRGYPGKNQNR